jgi:hypothetical protein
MNLNWTQIATALIGLLAIGLSVVPALAAQSGVLQTVGLLLLGVAVPVPRLGGEPPKP